jgi:Vitamin K-dependent gamma-carboxylase
LHRLLSEITGYLTDLLRSARAGWCGFFFTVADPTPLGLLRVAVGALLLWNVAILGLDLKDYLGSDGWIGPEAARAYLANNSPWAWSFWFWVPDRWLAVVWAGCLVVLALFTLGIWSRVTAVLAWVIAISIVRRAPAALFGFDQMVSTWAFYLAVFGASGQAVSVDRFLSRFRTIRRNRKDRGCGAGELSKSNSGVPRATVSANLCLRMIQLHLVLIYGSAGLAKLMGPEWWNGSAMEMIVLTPEYRRFDLTWLFRYPTVLALATHFGLLLEIGYPVLIWVRKLRPLVIASVIALHVGIDLILGLTEFGLAMMVANIAFMSGVWLRGLVTGMQQPSVDLIFARRSPRAEALAILALAADPDRVVRPIDQSSATAVVPSSNSPVPTRLEPCFLVRSDGRTESGVKAVLTLSRCLPLFWPIGLLGMVPGLPSILQAVYGSSIADAPTDQSNHAVCAVKNRASSNPSARTVTLPSAR